MRRQWVIPFVVVALAACGGSSEDSESRSELNEDSGTTSSETDSGARADAADPVELVDTWSSFAQGFFDSYCVECHGAGNQQRDYTLYEQVVRDADKIACGVAVEKQDGCGAWPPPQQFPIGAGPKPSDEERTRLVQWIAQGAAE